MADPVRVAALLTALPGKGPELVAAFALVTPLVRAEDGCLQYDLHPYADDPDRFVVVERWASREALAAHAASEHMRTHGERGRPFSAGPADVIVFADQPVV